MKRYAKELKLLGLVAVVAFVVCWLITPLVHRATMPEDAHTQLHKELHITADQHAKLEAIEQRFAERKTPLDATISEANAELAQAIMTDKRYSDRVKAAVDKIHHAQGELQKASLEHLFEMQTALTPEQSEKLNRMAADALLRHQ